MISENNFNTQNKMRLKIYFAVVAFSFFHLISFAQKPDKSFPSIAVVELFTSQGDINCPRADKILSDIIAHAKKTNKPVYCISLHVDFWNRFGWMDPFSTFRSTNRLQNYSSVFGDKETYTPKFIINGKSTPENPDQKKITEIINRELSAKAMMQPEFTYQVFDDTLDVSFNINFDLKKNKSGSVFYINVVIVESGLSTKVTKGDNEGKTLLNDNVSRLHYTTDLKSPSGLLRIPLKKTKAGPNKSLIFFIQDKKTKQVAGAASLNFN